MDGTRLRALPLSRLAAGLSVSALLAFACFPVFAFADSSQIEYESEIPNAGGHGKGSNGGSATSSSVPTHAQSATRSGSSRAHRTASGRQVGQGGGASGTGRGPGSAGLTSGLPNAHTSSGSGSSPLLPILIAILALAAVSIGAVMIRQRRQRGAPDASISPKAG